MLIHVVKRGELLWQIANYYRVPMLKIVEANGLTNPNALIIGQALVIPTEDVFYVVKSGDTLWKIAQNYGTTVENILASNSILNPSYIYPGLILYIPAPRHIIRQGETLWQIAQKYGVQLQTLMKINNIDDPSHVYPGTMIIIPVSPRPVIEVNGYIYEYGESGVPDVQEDGRYLTYLSPFAYRIREDGSLDSIDDAPLVSAAYSEGAVPMMAVTNFTSTELGENLAHIVLASTAIQDRLFTNMINIMKERGYQGLNIDFENVLPADKDLYNQLLQRLVNRLHGEKYFVSSALAPKTSAEQQGSLYTAHDYKAHGQILDFVILMTYEWGYRMGPPQAVSPLNRIKQVIDYAVSVIPRGKIFFGFQLYARDWLLPHVEGQEAETFSMKEAVDRAAKYGAVIQYDTVSSTPFYEYKDEQGRMHVVWFEDARSAQAKFDMVKSYNLRGISYWALGYPFPENWTLLEDNFIIRKIQ